jgi:hypothetical protein
VSDIAERLLAAIKAAEDTVPPLHLEGRYVGPRTDAERATLRRCAADRETVEEYQLYASVDIDTLSEFARGVRAGLDNVIQRLARGYGLEET